MPFQAKIILDSVGPQRNRLTTMEFTLPKLWLAEFNTHCAFCLDGNTDLCFDHPSGTGKTKSSFKMAISDFYNKWHHGIKRPFSKRHSYSTESISANRQYSTSEIADLLGVQQQSITRLCRLEGLPHSDIGGWFYVNGADFIVWNAGRPLDKYDAKPRLRKMWLRSCDESNGRIYHTHVKDVMRSGTKPCFKITFEDGKSLISSKEHLFLTENGWQTLEEATCLDSKGEWDRLAPRFAVNGIVQQAARPTKIQTVTWGRNTASKVHESNGYRCVICQSFEKLHLHHVDPIYHNYARAFDETNTTSLCEECHLKLHRRYLDLLFMVEYQNGGDIRTFWQRHGDLRLPPDASLPRGGNFVVKKMVRLVDIKYVGERDTYDIEVEGPWHNFVANGVIVHNSRNGASTRAIPYAKQRAQLLEDIFVPFEWPLEQKGMAHFAVVEDQRDINDLNYIWKQARDAALRYSDMLAKGAQPTVSTNPPLPQRNWGPIHKQLAGRLLEPFRFQTTLVTGDQAAWANFFHQRLAKDPDGRWLAAPEIRRPAELMYQQYLGSTPQVLSAGQWHLPLIQPDEIWTCGDDTLVQLSAARCARLSYLTHHGKRDWDEDLALFQRLITQGHWSPLEHVCRAEGRPGIWPQLLMKLSTRVSLKKHGKWSGWTSLRSTFPNEYVKEFEL